MSHNGSLAGEAERNTSEAITQLVYYSEAVVQPTILAVGIVTNAISVIVLCGSRIPINLRICIVSLTMSDLLATISGFIQMVVEVAYYDGDIKFGYWDPPAVASYTLYFVYVMFMCISASIVILLAVIRCCLVLRPVASRQFLTSLRTKLLCMFTALAVFVLFLPTGVQVVWQGCYDDNVTAICVKLSDSKEQMGRIGKLYTHILTVLFGPILVLVYVACFIAIRITLGKSRDIMSTLTERSMSVSSETGTRRRMSITSRVTRTLLAILVLDTVCTLPTVIQGINLILAPKSIVFDDTNQFYDIFDVIAEIFLCLKPTYNFWLYAFTHKEFQHRGWEILWIMQRRCRCFLLGLIKVPSSEEISSRTHSTLVPDCGCSAVPTTPGSNKFAGRITPLSPQAQIQLQRTVSREGAQKNRISWEADKNNKITNI